MIKIISIKKAPTPAGHCSQAIIHKGIAAILEASGSSYHYQNRLGGLN